ncbi:MAG: PPOX class F420-dependent oxidoreductase [Promethearchaeota archaeon]
MNDEQIKQNLKKFEPILQKKGYAHLATLMPHCKPQTTPVWYDMENGYIRINTAIDRVKDKNMKARSQVALSIIDPDNPYNYVTIRGVVVERTEEGADEHINSLAKKYLGLDEYPYRNPTEVRVLYRIKPISVSGQMN